MAHAHNPRLQSHSKQGHTMNEQRTASILQRIPVILAVTAASYGLQAQAARTAPPQAVSSTAHAAQATGTPVLRRAG